MATLTKSNLDQAIYKNHPHLTRSQSMAAVEVFLTTAKEALISGDDLLLSGFGKFSVKDKAPRKGRNPQTGEDLILDARRVVTFKPSGILRGRFNEVKKCR